MAVDNLDIGGIAAGAVIVAVFNLVIIMLTKTETILKVVERIKGVVGVNYKHRAKRSADELRISKLHTEVAKARIRNTFVTMKKWDSNWVWNWSDNFEPINIKGYCSGDVDYKCNQPVYGGYWYHEPAEPGSGQMITLRIVCTDHHENHNRMRAKFTMYKDDTEGNSDDMLMSIMSKTILSERDLRIAKEIKKLRLQFWR